MPAYDVEPIPPSSRPTCACLRCSCPDLVRCSSRHRCAQLRPEERRWTWMRTPDRYAGPVPVVSREERIRWASFDLPTATSDEVDVNADRSERLLIRAEREIATCSCGHAFVPAWFAQSCPRCGLLVEGA